MNFCKLNHNKPLAGRLCSLGAFLVACSLADAAVESAEIKVEGRLIGATQRDMDGDGLLDSVMVRHHTDKRGVRKRYLSIHKQTPAPLGYSQVSEREVPDDAIAYALGDFLGAGRPQVLYFTKDSVFALDTQNDSIKKILSGARFLFNTAEPDNLPFWNDVKDLNGDGLDDLIVAEARDYAVFHQDPDHKLTLAGRAAGDFKFTTQAFGPKYTRPERTGAQKDAAARARRDDRQGGPPPKVAEGAGWLESAPPIVTSRRMSRLCLGDANADNRIDLLALKRDKLLAWLQGAEGTFAREPLAYQLGPKGAKQTWDESRLPVSHGDVNGDGRIDFVLSEVDPKELTTKLRLYTWTETGIPAEPGQIIKVSGLGEAAKLIDINGDGLLDLGISTLRADKMLELRKAEVEELDATFYVFFFDKAAGQFSRRPDIKHEFTVAVNSDVDDSQSRDFTNFEGDFNGDGLKDLLIFENKGDLLVYSSEGNKQKPMSVSLASTPAIRHPIELPRRIRVEDLQGDGASEVILHYSNRLQFLTVK